MAQILDTSSMSELTPDLITKIRERAEWDLFFFAKAILGFDWLEPQIHGPICLALEQYKTNTRMRILLPRGWLKTTLCSISYPVWRAIQDPNVRILLAQNTFTNATAKLQVIRSIFEQNGLFRAIYPDLLPDKSCTWKSDSLCVKRKGTFPESTFEAAGIRTQVTSRHYDLIIEDDTVAPDLSDLKQENLCPTKEDIEQAIGWHRLVPPLLINPSESQVLVVGTRWFEKDLLSWITENEKYYVSIERACRETNGKADENGELTYPTRFSDKVLSELRASMGPYMFSCLYLNLPVRSSDMIFNIDWFQYYETEPQDLICYTTADPAGDPEDTMGEPDWNVVITCGKNLRTGRVYVLEASRGKMSPGELISTIFDHVRRYKPVKVGIETTQYQKSLLYWIRERMRKEGMWFMVEPLTHSRKTKNSRIMGLQPTISSGMLLFRKSQMAIVNELLAFPLGSNDDLCDALAMQLELWQTTVSLEEEKQKEYANDPFSLQGAIQSIRKKQAAPYPGVLDQLRPHVISHGELSRGFVRSF